jgi:hypothetical protein
MLYTIPKWWIEDETLQNAISLLQLIPISRNVTLILKGCTYRNEDRRDLWWEGGVYDYDSVSPQSPIKAVSSSP